MGLFSRKNKQEIKREGVQEQMQVPEHVTRAYTGYYQRGSTYNINSWTTDPETISAFFGGVELISSQIANIPIYVRDKEKLEIVENHQITNILKYGKLSKFNFIKQLIHDIYVNGNGIAYIKRDISGSPKELIYCPPTTYTIWENGLTHEVYYQIPFIRGGDYLDPSSVIHIFKNSKNGLIGIGINKYASITIPLSSAADKSALQFYDSGGNINGILQGKRILDTEEKMEAYNEWTNAFRGGNRNGNIAVIGNDFEYKQVGVSQKDAQSLETRQFNVLEICRYLNINPILLGIQAGSTYNNIEQAQMDLVIHTLLPLINLIEEEFNRKLIKPSERGKYMIDFDEDKIMFTTKSDSANYLTTLTKNGIISVNDAREALGFAKKPGCDNLIIPYTNINDNKVDGNNKEEKNIEEDKQ